MPGAEGEVVLTGESQAGSDKGEVRVSQQSSGGLLLFSAATRKVLERFAHE